MRKIHQIEILKNWILNFYRIGHILPQAEAVLLNQLEYLNKLINELIMEKEFYKKIVIKD
jgi:hypothetical protein